MRVTLTGTAATRPLALQGDHTLKPTNRPTETRGVPYIGEVIIRQDAGAIWARNGRSDPGLGVGSWLADPFNWVERARSDSTPMPLEEYVASVLAFADDPSDETSEALGLETRFQPYTAWDQFSDWMRRRRARP